MTVIEAVKQVVEKRRDDRIFPHYAPFRDIINLCGKQESEVMMELFDVDGVRIVSTINGYAVELCTTS